MNYSSVVLLSLGVFLIINYDIILKKNQSFKEVVPAMKEYRKFLYAVMIFFAADSFWGLFGDLVAVQALYIDTVIFFAEMAFSVYLWTKYVLAFLSEKTTFTKLLNAIGIFFLIFEWVVIIINFFKPILFSFDDDGTYHAGGARQMTMYIQLGMYFITFVYMIYIALKSNGKNRFKHITIGVFGLVMTIFIFFQIWDPLLPLYSLGYIFGTCLLHTFVLEDSKADHFKKLQMLLENETRQRVELSTARRMAYTDALTGVRNKHAYVEAESLIDQKIASKEMKEFGIVVFDLNGLKYVNDNMGHEIGDKYLKDACSIICDQFKHSAVFRIGGDEFVAILEGKDYENRDQLVSELDRISEENIKINSVVISTGIDIFDSEKDNSFNTIFIRADKKMYERKRKLKEMGSI